MTTHLTLPPLDLSPPDELLDITFFRVSECLGVPYMVFLLFSVCLLHVQFHMFEFLLYCTSFTDAVLNCFQLPIPMVCAILRNGSFNLSSFLQNLFTSLQTAEAMAGHNESSASGKKSTEATNDVPTLNAESLQSNMKIIYYRFVLATF